MGDAGPVLGTSGTANGRQLKTLQARVTVGSTGAESSISATASPVGTVSVEPHRDPSHGNGSGRGGPCDHRSRAGSWAMVATPGTG